MNDELVSNIKEISTPKKLYYGEWILKTDGLLKISELKKDKNMFKEYLNRYYYSPLLVILKDESLANLFKCDIVSKLVNGKRKMFFSKKAFVSSIIYNVNDVITDDESYRLLKKSIREKKNMYRDVYKLGEESEYYKELKKEYKALKVKNTFEEYVDLCRKKYTRLLSGYNTILELLDKPLSMPKMLDCFDTNKYYLYICYSIYENSKKEYELYGRIDLNIGEIEKYLKLVATKRKTNSFYNSSIVLPNNNTYTIDDLERDYKKLLDLVTE